MDEKLVEWLAEREANCLRIADGKTGEDRLGWIEDGAYFHAVIERIATLTAERDELKSANDQWYKDGEVWRGLKKQEQQRAETAEAALKLSKREHKELIDRSMELLGEKDREIEQNRDLICRQSDLHKVALKARDEEIARLKKDLSEPWKHSEHWHNPETGQVECECCCRWALDAAKEREEKARQYGYIETEQLRAEKAEDEVESLRSRIAALESGEKPEPPKEPR